MTRSCSSSTVRYSISEVEAGGGVGAAEGGFEEEDGSDGVDTVDSCCA